MLSELQMAKNTLAELQEETKRVNAEMRSQLEVRSNIVNQMATASSQHDIELLTKLMDETKAIDRVINNLAKQKHEYEAERKRVEQKVKDVEGKAERLRRTIKKVEYTLSPKGEVGKRIVEAENTLRRFSPEGDIGRQLREDRSALERLAAGGDLNQKLREAQHTLEMQLRVREAIESDLSGLRHQLAQLLGEE